LPELSTVVLVTKLVPIGKKLPEGSGAGVQVTERLLPQLSVAVGQVNFTIAPQILGSALVKIGVGQAIVGSVVSLTVKLVEQVLVLCAVSATKIVTEVVPQTNECACSRDLGDQET
jgi:hypothetical protein